jgi:hypothetical protein
MPSSPVPQRAHERPRAAEQPLRAVNTKPQRGHPDGTSATARASVRVGSAMTVGARSGRGVASGRRRFRVQEYELGHDALAAFLARRAFTALSAMRAMCARRACSARRARSAGGSFPSGSTCFANRASAAARAGAVRAERSSVRAQDSSAAIVAMRWRCCLSMPGWRCHFRQPGVRWGWGDS